MITLKNISLRRGQNQLLHDLNWTIYHRQRIGIIGENGAGKSSLFAMLLQELQPDGGDIAIPHSLKLAHVAQETAAVSRSILEFVLDGDAELRSLQEQLAEAEQQNDGTRIAVLHQRLSEIDAYTAQSRAAQLLDGLGFSHTEQQNPVSAFSGGWRVRINLAKALMCRSDVLLLDEPTNHLDLDAVLWLERWLRQYPGTLLVISHDRDFLDHMVDHIAHLSQNQIKIYTGNYSAFEKQRAEYALLQQANYQKQQKHIAHLQSFINRFRAKASKARQAQSRIKALERMELIQAAEIDSPFQFSFRPPLHTPNPLIRLENVNVCYGENIIFPRINMSITPADRIALLGPNGAGKSSLIKILAGEINPTAGRCERSATLKIGYFTQHQIEYLHLNENALDHLKRLAPQTSEQELRNFLGSFHFSGSRLLEAVGNFSGGEKSRLALALLIWQQPNLLLLDEPTNHLDLGMRHALGMALQEYQGAMILVSHDRHLINTTADRLILVADKKLNDFEGDLQDYEEWLLEFRKQKEPPNKNTLQKELLKKSQQQQDIQTRTDRRILMKQIKKIDDELSELQHALSNIETALTDLTLYEAANKSQLQDYLLQQAKLKKQLEIVESAWLEAHEKLESFS